MRIAVNGRFHAARPTGVQRVARELVEELGRRVDLTLYLPGDCDPPESARNGLRAVRGVLRGVAWEQVELPARTLRDRPDLSLDPANAGPTRGQPRVLILHDVFPVTHPEWYGAAFRAWFRARVVPAARRAARLVMFTEWAKAEAVRTLGIPEARIAVVTQGTAPFREPPVRADVDATLARMGLRRGYVLAGGAGDPRKNAPFLLEVMRQLPARDGSVPDLVVTGASYPHVHAGRPEPAPRECAGAVRVRRPGFVTDDELRALYAGAGVFCFPSHAEGFGRPPLEAMACGAPVIAADYGSAREVLGGAGMILPLEPRAWAEAVDALLRDEGERGRRIQAGRGHASGFRWEDAAGQLLEVCRSVSTRTDPTPAAGQPRAAGWRR